MLRVKLPVVDRIQPLSNKFAMGVENKATGDLKLNDSPVHGDISVETWIVQAEVFKFLLTNSKWHQEVEPAVMCEQGEGKLQLIAMV